MITTKGSSETSGHLSNAHFVQRGPCGCTEMEHPTAHVGRVQPPGNRVAASSSASRGDAGSRGGEAVGMRRAACMDGMRHWVGDWIYSDALHESVCEAGSGSCASWL